MVPTPRHLPPCCPGPASPEKKTLTENGDAMTDTILEELAAYIAAEYLEQSERVIDPDEPLLSSGLIDSFSIVDLSLFVERNFGVHIDDIDLNASSFDTLNQLSAYIKARQ